MPAETAMPIAQAKAHFSDVLRRVEDGEDVVVTRGVKQEPVAVIISMEKFRAKKERKLGTLAGRMEVVFHDDWHMTDEELLAS
ncbi:MAG: type II toxin-antitoxin system prevent-host-death family antitoxin [Propionibacteriaceae bacterium]|nr:type II toxin-antitoxin system prevent-host-death family antitoxin [Propionibacteriaceae bacterium]